MDQLTPNCAYWKVFGTVFVSWQGVAPLSSGWNTVGTLPEGFRPTAGDMEDGEYRVSAPVKQLGGDSAQSTGHIDVISSGLVRVWVPRAFNAAEPCSGQVFFR